MKGLTSPFVLQSDVVIESGRDIASEQRRRAGCTEDEYVISRRNSRARAKALSAETMQFVSLFKTPLTFTAAIRQYAAQRGERPEDVLDQLFPVLSSLVNSGFLVHEHAVRKEHREPRLRPGTLVGAFAILESILFYEDTEVYRVRARDGWYGALKIARQGDSKGAATLAREADICEQLDGRVNPGLLARGSHEGCSYLVVDWRPGRDLLSHAELIRNAEARPAMKLRDLAIDVVSAYAHLHAQGVVHGDVHPHNVIVGEDGRVTLIDFGVARVTTGAGAIEVPLGGVAFYYSPELAGAALAGRQLLPPDELSEQYAVACLLYLVFTGQHYLDFSFDERIALQQIRDEPVQPFSALGAASWPQLEAVLSVALAKQPAQRYPSMAAFAAALRAVEDPPPAAKQATENAGGECPPNAPTAGSTGLDALDALLSAILAELLPGPLLARRIIPELGSCSVYGGVSGIAYVLYRIACIRDDPRILATAWQWSAWADHHQAETHAYFNREEDIVEASVGVASIPHSAVGTAYVHALIALAAGRYEAADRAIARFVELAETRSCRFEDVFLGRAGQLVASAVLLDALKPVSADIGAQALLRLGQRFHDDLRSLLARQPSVDGSRQIDYLGMAHGWAGLLYALMLWEAAAGMPTGEAIRHRLDELAACARPGPAGVRLLIHNETAGIDAADDYMAGWCNGAAGQILTWLLAERRLGDPQYGQLARRLALQAIADTSRDTTPTLCCGKNGLAYALLALHGASGETRWLDAARTIATAAAAAMVAVDIPRYSLFGGALATALLACDLPRSAVTWSITARSHAASPGGGGSASVAAAWSCA